MKRKHGNKNYIRKHHSLLVALNVVILLGSTLLTTPGSAFRVSSNEQHQDIHIKQDPVFQEIQLDHESELEGGFEIKHDDTEAFELDEVEIEPEFNDEDSKLDEVETELEFDNKDSELDEVETESEFDDDDSELDEVETEPEFDDDDSELDVVKTETELNKEDNKQNSNLEENSLDKPHLEDGKVDCISLQTNEDNQNLISNPNFLYGLNDVQICHWYIFGGNSPLNRAYDASIAPTPNEGAGPRNVLWPNHGYRVLLTEENTSQGYLLGFINNNDSGTTFGAGQTVTTIPGVEYEVSINFQNSNVSNALTVYDGRDVYSGPNAMFFEDLTTDDDPQGFIEKNIRFVARSDNTTIGIRAYVLQESDTRVVKLPRFSMKGLGVYRIGNVEVRHLNEEDQPIAESESLSGRVQDPYTTSPVEIAGYRLKENPENKNGLFTEENILVQYIYELDVIGPLDPLNPDQSVRPEGPPILPDNQGFISIDFVSSFDFGKNKISFTDKPYYAKPQRLLNESGQLIENEDRPNYIQITDNRPDNNGWNLSVTQLYQFKEVDEDGKYLEEGDVLTGASLTLQHAELVSATNPELPTIFAPEETDFELIPGVPETLIHAPSGQGQGTWIYRFGNKDNFDTGVMLEVPAIANPKATSYQTTLHWELSWVPGNPNPE